MKNNNSQNGNSITEINLKDLLENVLARKWLFIASLAVCIGLAMAYLKMATPYFEVGTTVLIDPSGKSRMLGDSKYIDGGVGMIETEKNLYNEIGVMKSYELIKETVRELKFGVSYYSREKYNDKEHYGYFPFEVILREDSPQLYYLPFNVEILTDSTFRLSIEEDEFKVSNPETGTIRDIDHQISFSDTFTFGKPVKHDYFNFILKKPDYKVIKEEFEGLELFFMVNYLDDMANMYRDMMQVEQVDLQASILKLTTYGPVVQKEVDFLETLTRNYIETKLSERDQIALNKESFIQKQLAGVTDSLAKAEQKLEAFRRTARAVDLNQTASNALNQAQALQTNQAQVELNLKYYQSQLDNLKDSSSIDNIIAPTVVGINHPLLNENLLELKKLNLEKTRSQYIKGNKSLDLEILNEQIKTTKSAVEENLVNLVQSSQLTLADLNGRITSLEGVINQLPSSEKQLLNYERNRTLYENLFNYLSQELAKNGIAKAEDIVDTKILDAPMMIGTSPVSPKKNLILGLAVLFGLTIPMVWIVLYDSIDETIQSIRDIEAHSNLQVAASIAHDDSRSKRFVSDLSEWRLEESFRDLSASLQFLIPDPGKNILGVTSTIPGEGKSFCAINLAIRFAQSGKKTLLMDFDFRKPSIIEEEGEVKRPRLSKYLQTGKGAIEKMIYSHQEIANFDYIPSDVINGNPHELLSGDHLEGLFATLKENYEYIIVDSPALGLVSDYLLISKYIDVHLFVLRRNVSKFSFLMDLHKLRKKGSMESMYIIFNDAYGKSFKYGYSSYEYGKEMKRGSVNKSPLPSLRRKS